MNKFEFEIVNYIEGKGLVAELYYESLQWGEISLSGQKPKIQLYPHPNKKCWLFSLKEALASLHSAKEKLLSKSKMESPFDFRTTPTPQDYNDEAEKIMKEILKHPNKTIVRGVSKRFGDIVDIYDPYGRGVRYNNKEEFIGFLELWKKEI